MRARRDMPETLKRSPRKAQDPFGNAHDTAVEEHGTGELAYRIGFAGQSRMAKAELAHRTGFASQPRMAKTELAHRTALASQPRVTKADLAHATQRANAKSTRPAP